MFRQTDHDGTENSDRDEFKNVKIFVDDEYLGHRRAIKDSRVSSSESINSRGRRLLRAHGYDRGHEGTVISN